MIASAFFMLTVLRHLDVTKEHLIRVVNVSNQVGFMIYWSCICYKSSIHDAFSKLRMEMGSGKMLTDILEPLRGLYDYIIVDTCPSLGTLTINALTAADEVIIAVNPQLLAMMGLQDFIRTVKKVRSRLNDRLQIAGILLTMCDVRTNLYKVITEQLTDTFDGQIRIFKSIIPNTVKVGESIYYSEPLLEYAPENKACKAYQNLAEEVDGDES